MRKERLFGTDGIRRKVSEFSLDFLVYLGQVIGDWLYQGDQEAPVLIGRDTRISGEMIEAALTAGLLSQGVSVDSLGVIPTPGVAYLTKQTGAKLGIVLSGSHNCASDNGIKFFGKDGFKIAEAEEEKIEEILREKRTCPIMAYNLLGKLESGRRKVDNYANHLIVSWKGKRDLSNYKVVVDCSNGATSEIGPAILKQLGAEVIALNNRPDGVNINPDYDPESYDSHKPVRVRELVIKERADLGIVFDGDGDRVILVDEQGNFVDGDHMLAMLASNMMERGFLAKKTAVTTIMRNLGLDIALQEMGVKLEITPVGDRHIADSMVQNGYVLGGEQSGHIIIFDDGQTTGDGVYVALRVAALLADSRRSLSSFAGLICKHPQKIKHVRNVPLRESTDEIPGLTGQVEKSRMILSRHGPQFVNVRYSGTEKGLVRITVKGIIQEEVEQEASNIANVIESWKKSI